MRRAVGVGRRRHRHLARVAWVSWNFAGVTRVAELGAEVDTGRHSRRVVRQLARRKTHRARREARTRRQPRVRAGVGTGIPGVHRTRIARVNGSRVTGVDGARVHRPRIPRVDSTRVDGPRIPVVNSARIDARVDRTSIPRVALAGVVKFRPASSRRLHLSRITVHGRLARITVLPFLAPPLDGCRARAARAIILWWGRGRGRRMRRVQRVRLVPRRTRRVWVAGILTPTRRLLPEQAVL